VALRLDSPFEGRIYGQGMASAARLPMNSAPIGRRRCSPWASLYHCHNLDHEDLGMMGVLQIEERTG